MIESRRDQLPDELQAIWDDFVPFDSLLTTWMAGPQPLNSGPDCFSNDGSPYFCFEVDDPRWLEKEEVLFICFKEGIKVQMNLDGEYWEEYQMTHKGCLEYLSQLPMPFHHFLSDE